MFNLNKEASCCTELCERLVYLYILKENAGLVGEIRTKIHPVWARDKHEVELSRKSNWKRRVYGSN